MKKLFSLCLFVLLVGGLKGQNEVLLRTLGRAPLAPYLMSQSELRSVLKKHNEEIGRALDFFPGGALGEEVYVELYEEINDMPIWKEEIPIGQKIYWMVYRGGVLKNVRWIGDNPMEAFVFEMNVGGKKFKFATPLRCGNISLVEMREIPAQAEKPQEPQPQPREKPQEPQPQPQPKQQEKIIPAPQSKPALKPALVEKNSNSNWKIKVGVGWNKMAVSSLENEEKTDFSLLIPKEDNLFYCEDGTAAWLYTPGGKGSPFSAGQTINLLKQINDFESKQSGAPLFVGIEGRLMDNLYIGVNFFHIGKFDIQYNEVEENIFINEMRFLGNYEIDDVDVYYVGFNRQRNMSTVDKNISVNEISAELKYEISPIKDFSILPLVGLSWQMEKGQSEKKETISKLYPFREEVISTENVDIPSEKINENYFHPYVGLEMEVSYFFLRGKYCFGNFSKQYNSPWEIQGGILIKF